MYGYPIEDGPASQDEGTDAEGGSNLELENVARQELEEDSPQHSRHSEKSTSQPLGRPVNPPLVRAILFTHAHMRGPRDH
jgi:hypothetical protein